LRKLFIILQSSIMQNLRIFGYLKESILNLELRAVLKKLGDNQTARAPPVSGRAQTMHWLSESGHHHPCWHPWFLAPSLLLPPVSTTFKSNARPSRESLSRFASTPPLSLCSHTASTLRPAPTTAAPSRRQASPKPGRAAHVHHPLLPIVRVKSSMS
jgi:hypothetical protein